LTPVKSRARSNAQDALIAIGFTSGLGSIACSVLSANDGEYESLWSEVLSGPRQKRGVSHHRRYKAHRLMFEIFFDRWPPAVIALGPPAAKDEPLEWVIFMRTAMFELGKSVGVPVICFEDDASIARALAPDAPRAGLKGLIRQNLPGFASNKRRTILSTGSAMAGAVKIASTLP